MQIFSKMKFVFLTAITGYLTAIYAPNAQSTAPSLDKNSTTSSITQAHPLNHFKPRPNITTKLDYGVWTQLLEPIVIDVGPSIRVRTKSYDRGIGTRFRNGTNQPYRLEGNKVLYPYILSQTQKHISDYAAELEVLGTQLDIPALERNQQLAFWINLHNAVIVREISKHYPGPKRQPRNITPIEGSSAKLHTAKILKIDGIALSLEDIRQRIVYPNWQNPDVAFAFYLGDVSSPSLSDTAYEPTDLAYQLKSNAEQYVSSLLSMEKGKVSRIYQDIAPWYFPNFEPDLAAYLKTRMRDEVFAEYESRGYRGIKRYSNFVNDITSGRGKGRRSAAPVLIAGDNTIFTLGKDFSQYNSDLVIKVRELRNKEWFQRGTVIIEDIETNGNLEVK